jgi:hypothetical protein
MNIIKMIEKLRKDAVQLNSVYGRTDLPIMVGEVISMARRRSRDFHVDMHITELLSLGMMKLHEIMTSSRYKDLETAKLTKALRTAVLNAYNDKYSMSRGKARRNVLQSEWASRAGDEGDSDREHPDDPEQYAHDNVRATPEMRGDVRLLQKVIKRIYEELDTPQAMIYNALLSGDYENPADVHRGLGMKYDYVMDTVRLLAEKLQVYLAEAKKDSYLAAPCPPGTASYRIHATLRGLALRGMKVVTFDTLQEETQRRFIQMTKVTELQRELARYGRDESHKAWEGAIRLGKVTVVEEKNGREVPVEKDAVYLIDAEAFMQSCGSQEQRVVLRLTQRSLSDSSSSAEQEYSRLAYTLLSH